MILSRTLIGNVSGRTSDGGFPVDAAGYEEDATFDERANVQSATTGEHDKTDGDHESSTNAVFYGLQMAQTVLQERVELHGPQ